MDVGKIRIEQNKEARSQKTGIQKKGMRVMEDGGQEQEGQSDKVTEDGKVDKGWRTEDGVTKVMGNGIRKTE